MYGLCVIHVGIQGWLGYLAHDIDDLILISTKQNIAEHMERSICQQNFNVFISLNWHTIFPSLRHYTKLLRKLKRDLPTHTHTQNRLI